MTGADCPCVCHGRWQHPCNVEGGCGHLHTDRPAEPAVDYDMARLQLDAAVQQLIQPTVEKLDRDPDPDLDNEHDAELDRLHRRLVDQRSRDDHDAIAYTLRRIAALAEQAEQRRVRQAQLPSLLDQLEAAVESSSSLGGPSGAGATRSPIGLAAAELLADIRQAVRWGTLAHPDGKPLPPTLREQLRAWAARSGHWQTEAPHYLAIAAQRAEQWVEKARAILTPPRTFGIAGACPRCGRRTAHVRDDAGDYVRRDAVQVDYTTETARCLAHDCDGVWPPEMLAWLGATMRADEKAG